jgi:hypothetical protein
VPFLSLASREIEKWRKWVYNVESLDAGATLSDSLVSV